jgi:hypothetical protein
MKLWHVPCCIVTMALGIYLSLVYLIPSFVPEYHEVLFHGDLYKIVPFGIAVLVGSPLFSLWFYTKAENDENIRNSFFD